MPSFGRKEKLGTLPRLGVFIIDLPEDIEAEPAGLFFFFLLSDFLFHLFIFLTIL